MLYDIKTYRLAHGITQEAMAQALGLKKSSISMIENGKRQLPEEAQIAFRKLQMQKNVLAGGDNATFTVPAVRAEDFFLQLKAEHQHHAGDYIRIYIGDLNSEKHRLEKHLKTWTDKFEAAGMVLKHSEFILRQVEEGKLKYDHAMDGLLTEKSTAEQQLREIIRHKPELAMIRLEGIKKELAAAKLLLGKRQRFPVLDKVTPQFVEVLKVKEIGE